MIQFHTNASLLPHNTFGMDVRAALLVEYSSADELCQVLHDPQVAALIDQQRKAGQLPFWHIGSGSNLLFTADYPGVILHSLARGIRIAEADGGGMLDYLGDSMECYLEVEAGTLWDDVCAYCAAHGLYGPENLSLIPGEAGAAAVQNIGAYGVEVKDLIERVICWDVEADCPCHFTAELMQYGYRESLLKHPEAKARYIVTSLLLRTQRTPKLRLEYAGLRDALGLEGPRTIDYRGHLIEVKPEEPHITPQQVRDAVIRIRQGKLPDPAQLGNAGSFFKNPVVTNDVFGELLAQYPAMPHYTVDDTHTKIPAGWLIEQCGWKGRNLGRAGVYERQSLVLVNRGGARPDEVVTLCHTIVADVRARFGIAIEPEVNII